MARWVIQKFSSFPRKNFGDRIRNEIMFIRNKSHGEENFEGFERRDKYRRRIYVSPVFFCCRFVAETRIPRFVHGDLAKRRELFRDEISQVAV